MLYNEHTSEIFKLNRQLNPFASIAAFSGTHLARFMNETASHFVRNG